VRSSNIQISSVLVKRIGFLYLLLPVFIFCLGYLRIYYSIPIVIILSLILVRDWRLKSSDDSSFVLSRRLLIISILIILFWVGLSGIGGFAFQNADFHIRNAIFHDLINNGWPVKYHTNISDPSITYSLTYYIGYWLPAALIGKLTNWRVANISLYVWSVIGVLLILFLLFSSKKSRPYYFIFLIIFFSGMDGLGVLLLELTKIPISISLWPPFTHLEWWIPGLQFSSFTTQLFWVFNQAIPAWLCMSLLWTANERKNLILIWSLCIFCSPLPAMGMLPFLILKIPKALFNPEDISEKNVLSNSKSLFSRLKDDVQSIMTVENIIGGGIVLLLTYFYFSTNINSSNLITKSISGYYWILYVIFVIFEGFLLWSVFRAKYKFNLNWYLAGFLVLVIPLITIKDSVDFCMRASIPTLFMLMVWSAEMLASTKSPMRIILIVILCIGAITPIYEINRSVYRTAKYLLYPPSQSELLIGQKMNIYENESFEYDHPYTLTADSFKSLSNFDPEKISYFLARADHSFFYEYLAK
jgi:hypothetical protein